MKKHETTIYILCSRACLNIPSRSDGSFPFYTPFYEHNINDNDDLNHKYNNGFF